MTEMVSLLRSGLILFWIAVAAAQNCKQEDVSSFTSGSVFENASDGTLATILGISGDTSSDISLRLTGDLNVYFRIDDKNITVTNSASLNRDSPKLETRGQDSVSITGQVACTVISDSTEIYFDASISMHYINKDTPEFTSDSSMLQSEFTPAGTVIWTFTGNDGDNTDQSVTFSIKDPDDTFEIKTDKLVLKKELDYEETKSHIVTMIIKDQGYNKEGESVSLYTEQEFVINVLDYDDLPPVFQPCDASNCVPPLYKSNFSIGETGTLVVEPESINAVDGDASNATIIYTFVGGTPGYETYFDIDSMTGEVTVKSQIPSEGTYSIAVKAEQSNRVDRSAIAYLQVQVTKKDDYKPNITSSSITDGRIEGVISEDGSETIFLKDASGNLILLTATDKDESDPFLTFKITPSRPFQVSSSGYIFALSEEVFGASTRATIPTSYKIEAVNVNSNSENQISDPLEMEVIIVEMTTTEATTEASTVLETTPFLDTTAMTTLESTSIEDTTTLVDTTTMPSTAVSTTFVDTTTAIETTTMSSTVGSTTIYESTLADTTLQSTVYPSPTADITTSGSTLQSTSDITTAVDTTFSTAGTTKYTTTQDKISATSTAFPLTTTTDQTPPSSTAMDVTPTEETIDTSVTIAAETSAAATGAMMTSTVTVAAEVSTSASISTYTDMLSSTRTSAPTNSTESMATTAKSQTTSTPVETTSLNTIENQKTTVALNAVTSTVASSTSSISTPNQDNTSTAGVIETGPDIETVPKATLVGVAAGLSTALFLTILIIIYLLWKLMKKSKNDGAFGDKDSSLNEEESRSTSEIYENGAYTEENEVNDKWQSTDGDHDKETVTSAAVVTISGLNESIEDNENDPETRSTEALVLHDNTNGYVFGLDSEGLDDPENLENDYDNIDSDQTEEQQPSGDFERELMAKALAVTSTASAAADLAKSVEKPAPEVAAQFQPYLPPEVIQDGDVIKEDDIKSVKIVTLKGYGDDGVDVKAVLKSLDTDLAPSTEVEIVKGKIAMMEQLSEIDHPYILRFYGSYERDGCLHYALKYAENGNLKDKLVSESLNPNEMMHIMTNIANGLRYLHAKNITHGSIWAKAVMLDDMNTPMLTDIEGNIPATSEYKEIMRWQAIEVVKQTSRCTPATDVWSFGTMMWEIISKGATPYADVALQDLGKKMDQERLRRPKGCSESLFRIMESCWNIDPKMRPDMQMINSSLAEKLLEDSNEHIRLDLNGDSSHDDYSLADGHIHEQSDTESDVDFTAF